MQIIREILFLGICAVPFVASVIYEDLELQAIVIDDKEDFSFEVIPPFIEEATTQNPGGENSCKNSIGVAGTCLKVGECFPYLADESEPIYDILKTDGEDCPQEGLICCPDFASSLLPTKKPTFEGSDLANVTKLGITYGINEDCGSNHYQDPKVLGGVPATPGEFPFMVSLVHDTKQKHFCGASLIDNQWILTAAHCLANIKNITEITVNLGDHDVTKDEEVAHQSRKVKRGHFHKNFNFNNLQNDIAILQLNNPVTFSDSIQPICLNNMPGPAEGQEGKLVLCGWGKLGASKPQAEILQKVKMAIVHRRTCQKDYGTEPNAPKITENQMCAGEKSPVKDACHGDSGGPLSVISENNKALQVGIVSWGVKQCGAKPAVYTRVDKYISWIRKSMQ